MCIFRHFHGGATIKTIHFGGYFTIILTEHIERVDIAAIFRDCWKHHMVNVNVMSWDEVDNQVNVFTYFPFSLDSCEQIEPVLLMTISNETIFSDRDLFRNKLKNFHGCPLWLSTYTVPPYMILHEMGNGVYKAKGIEGNLYRELGKSLNFRPMVRIGQERHLGGAKANFDLLRKGVVNLTMFAIVNTVERSTEFTASFPYAYASIYFTAPHGPPISPFVKLALPFQPLVWLCIVIIFAATIAVNIYVSCGSKQRRDFVLGAKNQHPLLHFINMSLGGVVTQLPIRNFARTIFTIWLIGSLVLRNIYQGALFNLIQSQKPALEFTTLEQLAEHNFTIYASVQTLRILELGSPHLRKKLVFSFNSNKIIILLLDRE